MTSEPAFVSDAPDACQAHLTSKNLVEALQAVADAFPEADMLTRVQMLRALRESIDEAIDESAKAARNNGATWQALGRAAGMSRQAAHERWKPHDDGDNDHASHSEALPQRRRTGKPTRERVEVGLGRLPVRLTFDVTRTSVAAEAGKHHTAESAAKQSKRASRS